MSSFRPLPTVLSSVGWCGMILCLAAGSNALEVPPGFVAETIATNLNAASAIAPSPDGRIFIADQTGSLLVWKNGRVLDRSALNLSNRVDNYWERGLIGLALAPQFPREPHLFVLYVANAPFTHHVLARFTVQEDEIDPVSEMILLAGDDQAKLGGNVPAGHQGGALRFGPDGKLYVSIGEQTAGEPSQRLDTLQGKILRLNRDGSVPEDNPFLAQSVGKYRTIFARGVRNSFGLAVQPRAGGGRMFFTDVGGSAFEEINELRAGGNYGWPQVEGLSTNAAFVNPLYAYSPLVGQSIVGGAFIGRGTSGWPEKWRGKLFFADFMKHWVKAIDVDAPTNVLTFARGLNGPVATELAPDGSLLVLNRGAVWRDPNKFIPNAGSLIRIRYVGESGGPPPELARSSTSLAALGLPMNAGLLPRKISKAEWEHRFRDVQRWPIWINSRPWHHLVREQDVGLYLPTGGQVHLSDPSADVSLPPGAVIVRDFNVGNALTDRPLKDYPARRIETRLLVIGKPYSYGASYRWRGEEADLVEDGELVTIKGTDDTRGEPLRSETANVNWWFPALDDAISFPIVNPFYWISTVPSDFVLLSPVRNPFTSEGGLSGMQRRGALTTTVSEEGVSNISAGTNWDSPLMTAEERVRSYLHGNCSVCHQPGGPSRGNLDLRLGTPLAQTGLLDAVPLAGDLGVADARIVAPGSPGKSILVRRLKDTGFFRMPPIANHNEPSPILPVVEEWILRLQPTAATIQR